MSPSDDPSLRDFQSRIKEIYFQRDSRRGVPGTFMWFVEEVGELARSLRADPGNDEEAGEFADCLAWLSTLASMRGVDLSVAAWRKYGGGCPRCAAVPCSCSHRESNP